MIEFICLFFSNCFCYFRICESIRIAINIFELKMKLGSHDNLPPINRNSYVMLEWRTFVAEEKERQLVAIIQEENLKDDETRRFMESAFRDGSVKTTGTDIDRLMPPISRFGGGNRAAKKQTIIDKLKGFFDRFFGIG